MYKIGKCFETMYHYQHEAGCTIIQHIYKVQKRIQVFDVAKMIIFRTRRNARFNPDAIDY